MQTQSPTKATITKSQLKSEYGFTDTAITKFLGTPDGYGKNPHYSKYPLCLFDVERVEKIVNSTEFKSWLEKKQKVSNSRKTGAKKAVDTKMAQAIEYAKSELIFWLPSQPFEEIILWADPYPVNSYLRHEFTNYDWVLDTLQGKVGKANARLILHDIINDEIRKKYSETFYLNCPLPRKHWVNSLVKSAYERIKNSQKNQ